MGSVGQSKVVLITGGNSGVGYEACKIFVEAEKPYHVLCAARSDEKASGAVKSIQAECPKAKNTIEPLTLDINDDASIKKAVAQVTKSPGVLDVLINNAGAYQQLFILPT
jgi:NAD(P)-dependent dehydrogenase (short-subunit alcohol dehydrogenase family)